MTGEVKKTVAEINKRIEKGKAVVLTASEMVETVRRLGKVAAAKEVDVVTTGTFSPMSGSPFEWKEPDSVHQTGQVVQGSNEPTTVRTADRRR